jgi:hypothetical protein
MLTVGDEEARAVYEWYRRKGLKFYLGKNEESDLTETQVVQQCKMYIAALRIADEFGCATIGIQYQQGLKDLCPASDLVEGTLNNEDRPPVFREGTRQELYKGQALPHFNEVDECAGVDGLVTHGLWRQLGYAPESPRPALGPVPSGKVNGRNRCLRLGVSHSGAASGIYRRLEGAESMRQPAMYCVRGGTSVESGSDGS